MALASYLSSSKPTVESSVNDTTKRETFMVQKIPQEVVERIRNHRGFSTSTKKRERGKNRHGEAFLSYQFDTLPSEEIDGW